MKTQIATLALLGLMVGYAAAAEQERPNILFIFTGQQHAGMVSCAGNPHLETPAMDYIAANDVRFTRAYPTRFAEHDIQPMEGTSPNPALEGRDLGRSEPIFWEHEGNRAVRDGKWKLVTKGRPWPVGTVRHGGRPHRDARLGRRASRPRCGDVRAVGSLGRASQVQPWPWDRKR